MCEFLNLTSPTEAKKIAPVQAVQAPPPVEESDEIIDEEEPAQKKPTKIKSAPKKVDPYANSDNTVVLIVVVAIAAIAVFAYITLVGGSSSSKSKAQ